MMLLKLIPFVISLIVFSGCATPDYLSASKSVSSETEASLPEVISEEVGRLSDAPLYDQGSGYTAPKPIHQVEPVYPYSARRKGIEGDVTVMFLIEKDGHVGWARATKSPDSRLSTSAEMAVSQWRFTPGMKKGGPCACRMSVVLTFSLADT